MLGVCEHKKREAGRVKSLDEERCMEVGTRFFERMDIWSENLEKDTWARRKTSSSFLRSPRVQANKEMQVRSCSRLGRDGGSGVERWKEASFADDASGVLCAESEAGLVVVVEGFGRRGGRYRNVCWREVRAEEDEGPSCVGS